jgi:hypothetical protein
VVQLDFHQPPGQQSGGWEWRGVQHPHRDLPGLIGQSPGDRAQGHGGVGQVNDQILGSHGGALLDVGVACVRAGVGRPVLPGPGADQQIPHRVGVAGHVRQDMRPGPPRQQ